MNRGNMGKQISTAPKSKSKKVKKMQFGGMATAMPGPALSDMSQMQAMRRIDPPMAGAPAGSQMDRAAAIAQMQEMKGRPGMGDMPMPRVSQPRGPRPGMGDMPPPMLGRGGVGIGKPGMGPGRPGMGDMPMPRVGLPAKPGMGDMPSKPGPALRGGPAPMPGPALRGGPAPMPAMAMAKGGKAKKMAKGGKIDGCCMKGHTKGTMR